MKYQDAENLKPKFASLIGKPTKDSVVKNLIISFKERLLAEEHFKDILMGMGLQQEPAYINDYTLWARLEDDTFESVRVIIINDKVEGLYDLLKLLP